MSTTLSAIEPPASARVEADAATTRRSDRASLRVLHVINGEHYAGAERVQDLLAARLPGHGIEVGFACLKPGRFAALRQSQQTPLAEMPMRWRFDLWPAVRLAWMAGRGKYDILHTHSARGLLIARVAASICDTPIVHHVHGNTSSEVAGRRFTQLNAWAERKSLPAADAVIAVSASVAAYLRGQNVSEARLHVVPNGVPVCKTLCEMNGSTAHPTLGFVALLRPRKGLETFLEAASLARSRGLVADLRIVGRFESSAYEQQILALAQRLGIAGAIEWRGFQEDVQAELAEMDMLVFPSVLPEGMPMVLLEAMAAGVPIVASRVNGTTDVLRDGTDALMFPPGDAAELADAIMRLAGDLPLRERLRQAAYARQRDRFSDTSMAAAVAEIYRQVLAQRAYEDEHDAG